MPGKRATIHEVNSDLSVQSGMTFSHALSYYKYTQVNNNVYNKDLENRCNAGYIHTTRGSSD